MRQLRISTACAASGRPPPSVIDVTKRRGRVPVLEGVRVHTSRTLAPGTYGRIGLIVVTSVWRTIFDLAVSNGRDALREIVADAVRVGAVTLRQLEARAVAAAGTPGARAVLETVAGLHPETGRLRSELERDFLRLVERAGLPPPRSGFRVHHRGEFLALVDFAYPHLKIAIEVDGLRFHATPAEKAADDARQNRLVACGWIVLRYGATQIRRHPAMVAAQIRAALDLALAAGR